MREARIGGQKARVGTNKSQIWNEGEKAKGTDEEAVRRESPQR
jgi:hypothetical protein